MTISKFLPTGLRFAAGFSFAAVLGAPLHAGLSIAVSNLDVAAANPGAGISTGAGVGEDEESGGTYTSWISYSFTTGESSAWEINRIAVVGELYGTASVGAGLYATDSQGLPTGSALIGFSLAGNSGNTYYFTPDAPFVADAGATYAFSLRPVEGFFSLDAIYLGYGGAPATYYATDGWEMPAGFSRSGSWMSGGIGSQWQLDPDYRGVFEVAAVASASPIPEPASAAALAAGAALVLVGSRRRSRQTTG